MSSRLREAFPDTRDVASGSYLGPWHTNADTTPTKLPTGTKCARVALQSTGMVDPGNSCPAPSQRRVACGCHTDDDHRSGTATRHRSAKHCDGLRWYDDFSVAVDHSALITRSSANDRRRIAPCRQCDVGRVSPVGVVSAFVGVGMPGALANVERQCLDVSSPFSPLCYIMLTWLLLPTFAYVSTSSFVVILVICSFFKVR